MAGIRFQRRLEETAFCLGKETYRYSSTVILRKAVSEGFGGVNPAFRGGMLANLRELFRNHCPGFMEEWKDLEP